MSHRYVITSTSGYAQTLDTHDIESLIADRWPGARVESDALGRRIIVRDARPRRRRVLATVTRED